MLRLQKKLFLSFLCDDHDYPQPLDLYQRPGRLRVLRGLS